MSISVQCPGCEKKLKAKDNRAGKRVKCPSCGHVIQLRTTRPATHVNATISQGGLPSTASKGTSMVGPSPISQGKRVHWPLYAGGVAIALCLIAGVLFNLAMPGKDQASGKSESAFGHSPTSERKRESNTEDKSEPKPEPNSKPKAAEMVEPEPRAEEKVDLNPKAKPEDKTKPEPKSKPKAAEMAEPEPKAEEKVELKPEVKPEDKTKPEPSELAYDEVIRDIVAHTGKRVTWIASNAMSSSSTDVNTGEETQTYVYLAQDKEGNFFADYPFIFSHPGTWKNTRHTPAANKADNTPYEPGIKKVTGIIAGSTEYTQASGVVSMVPVLKDVTLDIPSDRQSFQILKKYIDSTSNATWAQHRVDGFVAVYSDSELVADAKLLMRKYK